MNPHDIVLVLLVSISWIQWHTFFKVLVVFQLFNHLTASCAEKKKKRECFFLYLYKLTAHWAHLGSTIELEKASISPIGTPRVLDQPIWISGSVINSIPNNCYCMSSICISSSLAVGCGWVIDTKNKTHFYKYFRNKTKDSSKLGPIIDSEGKFLTDNCTIANSFSNYFRWTPMIWYLFCSSQ